MNITDFPQHIDKTILGRGHYYYENDFVSHCEMVGEGEFSAEVEGTSPYEVFVKLDKQSNIISHDCDCPYDWGPVCKHEVAVFYHISENRLHLSSVQGSKIHRIKEELEGYTSEELVDLIMQVIKRNRDARESVSWALGLEEDS